MSEWKEIGSSPYEIDGIFRVRDVETGVVVAVCLCYHNAEDVVGGREHLIIEQAPNSFAWKLWSELNEKPLY